MLDFHGTGDPVVPYNGGGLGAGLDASLNIHVYPEPVAVAAWATRDRCAPTPVRHALSPMVERTAYRGCTAGTQVVLYRITGGGHTWPGGIDVASLGVTTHDVNAADLILAFFAQHRLPGAR